MPESANAAFVQRLDGTTDRSAFEPIVSSER
jgi:hypothetical protein